MTDLSLPLPVLCERITAPGLDPILAVWVNDAPGRGTVILQCYDQAWTASWGATGAPRIEAFFVACDVEYLTTKFTGSRLVSKRDEAYLARIVGAVHEALRAKAAA